MIAFTSIVKNADNSWTFQWASTGAPSYRVVLQGRQIADVVPTEYTFNGQGYPTFPPSLEVVPEGQLATTELFSPLMVIQWYQDLPATQYIVQVQSGATWGLVAIVTEVGLWVSTYRTPVQVDGQTYNYRVFAQDSVGNQSAYRSYSRTVVCPPVSPDGTFAVGYGSGNVTITPLP
jgi:hypothetical protein